MGINERKKIVFDTIQLERERDELGDEILAKEKQMKKLNIDLEFAESEYNSLENSGMKKFFLGLTGKREARIQEAQNELRRIRSELASVEFELVSIKNRIETIDDELKETDAYVMECISALEEIENGALIRDSILALRQIAILRNQISDKILELNPLLTKAEEIFIYGDIHTDLSGRRFNKRDTALREHTYKIKSVVNELIQLLEDYNSMIPEAIRIEYRENWMDNDSYWDNQHIAEESHDRVKKVDDWFFRFCNLWKTMKNQQDEIVDKMRNEVLDYLV